MIKPGCRLKAWILLLLIMSFAWRMQAQEVTLRGFIKDSATQTPITNASISIKGLRGGARSNQEGRFRIPTPQHAITVTVTSVGYYSKTINLDSVPAQEITFSLARSTKSIEQSESGVS